MPLVFQMRKLILEEAHNLSKDLELTGKEVVTQARSRAPDPFLPDLCPPRLTPLLCLTESLSIVQTSDTQWPWGLEPT